MAQKERLAGERAVAVQKEIADAIVAHCEARGVSQQEFGIKLGFSAGTANHNIRNYHAMSPGFILNVLNATPSLKHYKIKWFKALAEDNGLGAEDVVPGGAVDAAEKEEKIRRALLELQGTLVQLINNL